MHYIALSILLAACAAATEKAVDPVFEAKVEAAMQAIEVRHLAAAAKEHEAMLGQLGAQGVMVRPITESSYLLLQLTLLRPVDIRPLAVNGRQVLAVRFTTEAEATAALPLLSRDAILNGAWAYLGQDLDPDLEQLTIYIGGRFWVSRTKQLKEAPSPERRNELSRRAEETKVAAALRTGVFAAEIQGQGGSYLDADQDNVGEFLLIGQLSGASAAGKLAAGQLRLLPAEWNSDQPVIAGHRFAIYLPGKDNNEAVGSSTELLGLGAAGADLRERSFVAYAWPSEGTTGTVFAMCQDGQVRTRPWDGKPVAWQCLWPASKPWGTEFADGWQIWKAR